MEQAPGSRFHPMTKVTKVIVVFSDLLGAIKMLIMKDMFLLVHFMNYWLVSNVAHKVKEELLILNKCVPYFSAISWTFKTCSFFSGKKTFFEKIVNCIFYHMCLANLNLIWVFDYTFFWHLQMMFCKKYQNNFPIFLFLNKKNCLK